MRVNTTLVLLVVALALGGYIWLFELGGEDRLALETAAERKLVALAPDEIAGREARKYLV